MTTSRRNLIKAAACTSVITMIPSALRAKIEAAGGKKISLGLITDTHIGFIGGAEERLDAFLDEMKKLRPDALVQLGDFAFPNKKCQAAADKFNKGHQTTLHVIGNHDMDLGLKRADCLKAWGMPAPYYRHDLGGIRIIVLDGNDKGSPTHRGGYPSYIGPKQQQWLENELQQADKPLLILSHQPLAGRGAINNAADIQKLLSKHAKNILLCINGHTHIDHLVEVGGVSYLHLNSASYFWLGKKVRLATYRDPLYALLEIDAESGTIKLTGKTSEWKEITPEKAGYYEGLSPEKRASLEKFITPKITSRKIG